MWIHLLYSHRRLPMAILTTPTILRLIPTRGCQEEASLLPSSSLPPEGDKPFPRCLKRLQLVGWPRAGYCRLVIAAESWDGRARTDSGTLTSHAPVLAPPNTNYLAKAGATTEGGSREAGTRVCQKTPQNISATFCQV